LKTVRLGTMFAVRARTPLRLSSKTGIQEVNEQGGWEKEGDVAKVKAKRLERASTEDILVGGARSRKHVEIEHKNEDLEKKGCLRGEKKGTLKRGLEGI